MTRVRAGGERLLTFENDPAHDQRVTCDEGSGQKHNEIIHAGSLTIARATLAASFANYRAFLALLL